MKKDFQRTAAEQLASHGISSLKFHYVQRSGLGSSFYKKLIKVRTWKNTHLLSWAPLYPCTRILLDSILPGL